MELSCIKRQAEIASGHSEPGENQVCEEKMLDFGLFFKIKVNIKKSMYFN